MDDPISTYRTCWSCKYFKFYAGCSDYSDVTPGDSLHISCAKSHFFESGFIEEAVFRACIHKAVSCKDFTERTDP